MYKLPSTTWYS